jgi:hypothetical protein
MKVNMTLETTITCVARDSVRAGAELPPEDEAELLMEEFDQRADARYALMQWLYTAGPRRERVRVSASDEYFLVVWPAPLRAARTYGDMHRRSHR